MRTRAHRDFSEAVEAVRIGTLIAQDRRALSKWRSHQARLAPRGAPGGAVAAPGGGGLTGQALEQVVMALRVSNPDIVGVRMAARG